MDNNAPHMVQHLIDNGINAYLTGDYNNISYPHVMIDTDVGYQHLALNSFDNTININIYYGADDDNYVDAVMAALDTYTEIEYTGILYIDGDLPATENADTNTMTKTITIKEILQIVT